MLDEEKASPPNAGNNSSDNSSSENLNQTKARSSFLDKFSEDLDPRYVYLPLLLCCFVTGLTDGTLYNGMWLENLPFENHMANVLIAYGTFVSMQTGRFPL